MDATFEIDATSLLDTPFFSEDPDFIRFAETLSNHPIINSLKTFEALCCDAIKSWIALFPSPIGKTERFSAMLHKIDNGIPGEADLPPIKTEWGGVSISTHELPFVEKFLVIKQGGFLSLETHTEKDEMFTVEEGLGLLLYRAELGRPLRYKLLVPGSRAQFAPGQEHCIIGLENLLVYERSKEPLGMDQDLIFIYPASAT